MQTGSRKYKSHLANINQLWLVLLIFLGTCQSSIVTDQNKKDSVSQLEDTLSFLDAIVVPSTDYEFLFTQKLPPEYYFDTLNIKDTVHRAEYRAYCLQSAMPSMKSLNRALMEKVKSLIKADHQAFEANTEANSPDIIYTYELGPVEFFFNDTVLSMCCIIDTYGYGGNHHNYSWYTFNYDLKAGEMITFQEVFALSTRNDSIQFVNLVKADQACMDWYTPFDSVDFSITDKGIYINPDVSWACGMPRTLLTYEMANAFLRPKWKKSSVKGNVADPNRQIGSF